MHYLRPPNASTTDGKDSSGVIMHLTEAPTPRAAVRYITCMRAPKLLCAELLCFLYFVRLFRAS